MFIAPEVVNRLANQSYDAFKADMFSMGILMWEVLVGRRPFSEYGNNHVRSKLSLALVLFCG